MPREEMEKDPKFHQIVDFLKMDVGGCINMLQLLCTQNVHFKRFSDFKSILVALYTAFLDLSTALGCWSSG